MLRRSNQVLSSHHSRQAWCAGAALVLTLVGTLWPRSAQAEEASKTPKVEVMVRAAYAPVQVGLLQAGIEGTYMLNPHLGFGGTLEAFRVDNGSDPQYSKPGTLDTGSHVLGFVEGDLLEGVFTPYARLGIGVGNYGRYQPTTPGGSYGQPQSETDFVGQFALGVALRLGPVLARASASPSLYGKDGVMVYGLGIGARF